MKDEPRLCGTCRTCKWWDTSESIYAPLDWGKCELTLDCYDEKSIAIAKDDDGMGAMLTTAPGFACVQWEAEA